jgi:hypothetical protein
MEGASHFYTFAYLRQAAHNAADTAKTAEEGSNYHRVSAVLFASLTIEAHLNHVGERSIENWDSIEPTVRWGEKLSRVAGELGVDLDSSKGWGQTAVELFQFRNKLAHGKTHDSDVKYKHKDGSAEKHELLDPQWLGRYWNDHAVARILRDLDQLLATFHEKAGLDAYTLNLIGDSELEESESNPYS